MNKSLCVFLKFCAKTYLIRTKPKIIAITGSVGKTSAKEAIFACLSQFYGADVAKSHGNLNTETGVPLAILGFKKAPNNPFAWLWVLVNALFRGFFKGPVKVLVLEMAADKPGDIKYLTSIARPDIAVLTNIGPSHLANFGEMENIIEEKTQLLRAIPKHGWAILNIEDELVKKISFGGQWQKMTYSISGESQVRAKNIKTEIKNFSPETQFQISFENEMIGITTPTLGEKANVLACLAAYSVCKVLEIESSVIKLGISKFKTEKHRMNVVAGKNQTTIIDDSYNANPVSMKAALDVLKLLPIANSGRKIAILGDMREIGKISDEAHKTIGEYAKEVSDLLIGIGDLAQKYQGDKFFKTPEEAINYILKEIAPSDIILVKASRAVGLEKVVDILQK